MVSFIKEGTLAEVLLLVGIPGSGKSTYAASSGMESICPDAIQVELAGNESDQGVTPEAWEIAYQRMTEFGEQEVPFILDATNLYRWRRVRTAAHIRATFLGVKLVAVVFDTPLEVCLARNTRREKNIPRHIVRTMHRQFNSEPVVWGEAFDRIDTITYQK